jgi:hypothetical protein
MKVVTASSATKLPDFTKKCLPVLLYGRGDQKTLGSVGAAVAEEIRRQKLQPTAKAWDLLSLALSVIAADAGVLRKKSPDGWTREIELKVGVREPDFWKSQKTLLESMLRFLTTDRWNLDFVKDGFTYSPGKVEPPAEQSVALLSGGVDSLVGALDLAAGGTKPFAVSQTVLGDGEKQTMFAEEIGGGLRHLQLNHNALSPGETERSQRSRSLIFLAYGTLTATSFRAYGQGEVIPLYVSENGLISINPPLTDARLGSLSTRTTHPVFVALFQQLLAKAELKVELRNPYKFKTKGEMLSECANQEYLRKKAHEATSCGHYRQCGLCHCGRCLPCMIRRAAFVHWKQSDKTKYLYKKLGTDDADHAGHNDVRSAALALATADELGLDSLLGASLASELIADKAPYRKVVERGLKELKTFLRGERVL